LSHPVFGKNVGVVERKACGAKVGEAVTGSCCLRNGGMGGRVVMKRFGNGVAVAEFGAIFGNSLAQAGINVGELHSPIAGLKKLYNWQARSKASPSRHSK